MLTSNIKKNNVKYSMNLLEFNFPLDFNEKKDHRICFIKVYFVPLKGFHFVWKFVLNLKA